MRNDKQPTTMIMKGTKPKQLMAKSRAGQSKKEPCGIYSIIK